MQLTSKLHNSKLATTNKHMQLMLRRDGWSSQVTIKVGFIACNQIIGLVTYVHVCSRAIEFAMLFQIGLPLLIYN